MFLRIGFLLIFSASSLAAQGSVLLVGGGSEDYNDWSDEPYRWLVDHTPNKKILVMHYSTGSTWLEEYFKSLGAVSATSFIVSSTTTANDSATYKTILAADGIFLQGGDQWQYVSKWKGTLAAKAIKEVFQHGGVIGGTSAGEMVMSEIVFDARTTSTDPRAALRNPLSSGTTFTDDFLGLVPNSVADSHFYERGRMGRLLAMLALYKSQKGREINGIGVDYNTALAVGPDDVAEVMGSGTVTLLRFAPNTTMILEASKPLSMTNVRMDQMTDGFKFNLSSGQIIAPASAKSFRPKSVVNKAATLYLDGSSSSSDWNSTSGSIVSLAASLSLPATDVVGIISSPSTPADAQSVAQNLTQRSINYRYLWLNGASASDLSLNDSISQCKAFIAVGNNPDSIAYFLSPSVSFGSTLRTKLSAGTPILFLSNDISFAADSSIGKLMTSIYGAYYGYLTLAGGSGFLTGVEIMPRIYENSDYIDNRISGLFWGMGKSSMPVGLLIDNGTVVKVSGYTLQVTGLTPLMIIDARKATLVDFPTWRDPGKANPRNNSALIGAMVHAVRSGDSFDISYISDVNLERTSSVPSGFKLLQNYPNPFNGITNYELRITNEEHIKIKIFNVLGKELATIMDRKMEPGTYRIQWDAGNLPSGIYFCRLEAGNFLDIQKMVLVR